MLDAAMAVEDFEAEYEEAAAAHHEHHYQVDSEEQLDPPPLGLEMDADADRRLRSIRYWREELDKVHALAVLENRRIAEWLEKHERRIEKRLRWNEDARRAYLWSTGKKTLDLPSGQLRRRAGRERVDIVQEEVFIDWAEKAGMHDTLIRVKKAVDKKAALQFVKDTGEEPPGLELNVSEDSFSLDVS